MLCNYIYMFYKILWVYTFDFSYQIDVRDDSFWKTHFCVRHNIGPSSGMIECCVIVLLLTSLERCWRTPRWWCRTWVWSPWRLGSMPSWWCGSAPVRPCPTTQHNVSRRLTRPSFKLILNPSKALKGILL